jgi:hypothetical protein
MTPQKSVRHPGENRGPEFERLEIILRAGQVAARPALSLQIP